MLYDDNYQKAEVHKKAMNRDSAIFYYKKAAVEYQKMGDVEKFVDVYNQIGIILTRQDKYETKLKITFFKP